MKADRPICISCIFCILICWTEPGFAGHSAYSSVQQQPGSHCAVFRPPGRTYTTQGSYACLITAIYAEKIAAEPYDENRLTFPALSAINQRTARWWYVISWALRWDQAIVEINNEIKYNMHICTTSWCILYYNSKQCGKQSASNLHNIQ